MRRGAPLAGMLVALAVALCLSPHRARAEVSPEVQKHFEAGNGLYQEGRYRDALGEYDAAYEKSKHNYKILYNRGQCLVMLHREPEAIESFQKYLDDGAAAIDPERRKKVASDIAHLKERVGTIVLVGVPDGATIALDDIDVGTTPAAARIPAGAGVHELIARPPGGGVPSIQQVKVLAGEEVTINVDLGTPAVAAPAVVPLGAPESAPPPAAVVDRTTPYEAPPAPPRRPPGGLISPAFMFTLSLGGSAATGATNGGNSAKGFGLADAGASWRFNSFWELGLYAAAAAGTNSPQGSSAAVNQNVPYQYSNYGLRIRLHAVRGRSFDGWFGMDIGRFQEKWTPSSGPTVNANAAAFGLGFGLDFPVARTWALGASIRYLATNDPTCESGCSSITTSAHGFVELGVRAVFSIPYGSANAEAPPERGTARSSLATPVRF